MVNYDYYKTKINGFKKLKKNQLKALLRTLINLNSLSCVLCNLKSVISLKQKLIETSKLRSFL